MKNSWMYLSLCLLLFACSSEPEVIDGQKTEESITPETSQELDSLEKVNTEAKNLDKELDEFIESLN